MPAKPGWLQIRILFILKNKPIHGYNLMRELKGGGKFMSPGTIYPALNALLKMGFVDFTEKSGPAARRKIFHITEKGLAQLI